MMSTMNLLKSKFLLNLTPCRIYNLNMDQMINGIKFIDLSKYTQEVNSHIQKLDTRNPGSAVQCSRDLLNLAIDFQRQMLPVAEALDTHVSKYELERGYVYLIGQKISSVSYFLEYRG